MAAGGRGAAPGLLGSAQPRAPPGRARPGRATAAPTPPTAATALPARPRHPYHGAGSRGGGGCLRCGAAAGRRALRCAGGEAGGDSGRAGDEPRRPGRAGHMGRAATTCRRAAPRRAAPRGAGPGRAVVGPAGGGAQQPRECGWQRPGGRLGLAAPGVLPPRPAPGLPGWVEGAMELKQPVAASGRGQDGGTAPSGGSLPCLTAPQLPPSAAPLARWLSAALKSRFWHRLPPCWGFAAKRCPSRGHSVVTGCRRNAVSPHLPQGLCCCHGCSRLCRGKGRWAWGQRRHLLSL